MPQEKTLQSFELNPNGKLYFTFPYKYQLTLVSLSSDATEYERTCVMYSTADKSSCLCSLRLGSVEQFSMNVVFDKSSEVIFSVKGKNTVFLHGSYLCDKDHVLSTENQTSKELIVTPRKITSMQTIQSPEKEKDIQHKKRKVAETAQTDEFSKRKNTNKSIQSQKTERRETTSDHSDVGSDVGSTDLSLESDDGQQNSYEVPLSQSLSTLNQGESKRFRGGVTILELKKGDGPVLEKGDTPIFNFKAIVLSPPEIDWFDKSENYRFSLKDDMKVQTKFPSRLRTAILGMKIGGSRTVQFPPCLAFKKVPEGVPKDSWVQYTITLLKIEKESETVK